MIKTKVLAIILCITTALTAFVGVSFADNTVEDSYEIVIEDGKLISGNSELIDQGFIVLGTPEGEESSNSADSTESTDAEDSAESQEQAIADGNLMDKLISAVEQNGTRTPVKDNSALTDANQSASGTTSVPTQPPSAVSPSVPTESESAITAINHPISIINPGIKYCMSTNKSPACFTYTDVYNSHTTANWKRGTLNRNASITVAVLYTMPYQVIVPSGYTLEYSFCEETHGSDNFYTYKTQRGVVRTNDTSGNGNYSSNGTYMFNVNGGNLRIVGGMDGNDRKINDTYSRNTIEYDKFYIDANPYEASDTTNSGPAPAFYVSNNGTLEIKNAVIKDSRSTTTNGKGGAINVNNGNVYLENVIFDNCLLTGAANDTIGGVIYVTNGTVTMKNCQITNLVSGQYNYAQKGGSIGIASGAKPSTGNSYVLQMENTSIKYSRSTDGSAATDGGGAIYIASSAGNVSLKNCTIQNCYTPGNGGAIHMESGGNLEMEGTTIQNCYSTLAESEKSGTSAGGGGMYINTTGTVSMTDCTVQNCYAQNGDGGGIFVDSATMSLTGCTINNNYITDTSTNYTYTLNDTSKALCAPLKTGAAIYAQNDANVTLTNTKVNNNQEGAAKIARGTIYITRRASVTMGGASEISNNKGGGGVYIYSKGTFTMTGGTISGNEYIYHNPTYGLSGYSIGNYGFSNGVAVLLHAETAANYGTFTMTGGTIKNHTNNTSLKGGAIGLMGGGVIEIKGGAIEANKSADSSKFKPTTGTTTLTFDKSSSQGGAIYIESGVAAGTLTISGGTIGGDTAAKGNRATVGGGVFMAADTTLTMTGGTIKYNQATGTSTTTSGVDVRGGGGIYAGVGVTILLQNGEISYNSSAVEASGGGGGVAVYKPIKFVLGKGTGATDPVTGREKADLSKKIIISNNFGPLADNCTRDGGGICARDSGIWIFNCEINGNTANYGAGIYITISSGNTTQYKLTILNGTIDGNKVGGGVFISSSNSNANLSMEMYGGSIDGNTLSFSAHEHGGAGVCSLSASPVYIYGGSVSNNISTVDTAKARNGGGFLIKNATNVSGQLIITGGTISGNETVGNGGGIYLASGAILSIKGTASNMVTISGNKAADANDGGGGGIYLNGNKGTATAGSAVTIQYADIIGNQATGATADGGGITAINTNLNLSYCTISGNATTDTTGGSNGGGIDFGTTGYSLTVSNCEFIGNTTYNWGGGLYCSGGTDVTISGSSFDGNKANKMGGGIALYNGVNAEMSNSYVGNNEVGYYADYDGTGGGISINDGGASDKATTLSLANCYIGKLIDENGQLVDAGNTAEHLGGGIYVSKYAVLNLSGTIDISNNTSTGSSGGGIYFIEDAVTPDFVGVNFSNNKAALHGGAISVAYSTISASNTLIFKGCTFDGNTAGGNGGAIRCTNTVLTINNGEVAGSSVISNNKAGGSGGAIYLINTTSVAPTVANYFKLSGTLYENNQSNTDKTGNDGFGGAIYISCGNGYIANNQFYGNTVYASGGDSNDGSGGAVFVVGTEVANSKLEFSINAVGKSGAGNRADSYGGGLAIGGYTKAAIMRGSFSYNHAKDGGGIYAFECTDGLLITPYKSEVTAFLGGSDSGVGDAIEAYSYTTIQGNTCNTNGAGLNLATNATLKNVKILDNSTTFDGGGVCIQGGKAVTMTGLNTIQGNSSTNYGGGVIILTTGSLTIEGNEGGTIKTVITQNKITGSNSGGAGVHVATDSSFKMSYGEITSNDASKTSTGANSTSHGGGLDITGGTAIINNVNISGNVAGGNGGGISLDDHGNNQGSLTATNCVVTGNTAANGGGVSVADGTVAKMSGSYIVGNSANGTMTADSTTMADAGAVNGVGGGVAVFDGGSLTFNVTNSVGAIYDNTATVAANDVFANGSGTSLSIPAASDMKTDGDTLNGVTVAAFTRDGKTIGSWWEDYKNSEPNYENGLFGDQPPAFRYEDGPVSIPAYTTIGEGTNPNGNYINTAGEFVSITFDVQKYNVGSITITAPTATDTNQRFVFELTGETMKGDKINLSISLGSGEKVTITELYPGTYTVTQKTAWSWRYSINGVTVDGTAQAGNPASVVVEIKGVSVTENHTVEYSNNRTQNLWLDHNSQPKENKAVIPTVVVAIDLAEAKRSYII